MCHGQRGLAFSLTTHEDYGTPLRTLHFFNAPRNCCLDQLKVVSSSYYNVCPFLYLFLFSFVYQHISFFGVFFVLSLGSLYPQGILFSQVFLSSGAGTPIRGTFFSKKVTKRFRPDRSLIELDSNQTGKQIEIPHFE